MFLISEKSSALAGDFFVARRIIRRLEVSLFLFFRPDKPKKACCCDRPALLRARGSGKTLSVIPVQTYTVTVLRARKCGKFPRFLDFDVCPKTSATKKIEIARRTPQKKIKIAKPVRAEAIQVSLPQISGPACRQDAVFADASVDSRAPDRSFGVA